MSNEVERTTEYHEAYRQAEAHWAPWHKDARTDLKAYAGDPWTEKDKRLAKLKNRELMSFPQLRRVINWISGYEIEHRLSITFDPMEGGDLATAQQLNMVALWALQSQNGYYVVSNAFEGALKTGINLVNAYNDRNSNTKFERYMYNQFVLDPSYTRVDLEDCDYGILRKFISKDTAKMLLPGKESWLDALDVGMVDNKFTNYRRPSLYGNKLLTFDEFQRRATRKRRVVIIQTAGFEHVTKSEKELDFIIRGLIEKGIPPHLIDVIDRWVPTVEVMKYVEGHEVTHDMDPFGLEDFSFSPLVAYFDPEQEKSDEQVQSIIHPLIDAQRVSDKRQMGIAAWIEQQIGAGLDYEQGALVDDEDAMKTGSGAPRLFKKNALAENRAKDRVVPDVPAGLFKDREGVTNEIPKMAGFNPDMMGFPVNQNVKISGVLSKLRMGAGLIGLRGLFSNREVSVKRLGKILLLLIQQYPGDKIKRIINKPPTDAFYNHDFGKYDVAVAEGMLGDTQRGIAYAELTALRELANNSGQPSHITEKMLIERSPIQQPLELIAEIEQAEKQAAQQRQKQEQLQDALQQLAIQQAQSEIRQQEALTEQQRTGAIENQTEAAYDRVKTAAEIQELQSKGGLEVLRMAVDLEKARIGAKKNDNSR